MIEAGRQPTMTNQTVGNDDTMTRLTPEQIIAEIEQLARQSDAAERLPLEVVRLLKENCDRYNWVGIYNLYGDELVLGPSLGKPSPHTRIKIDSGICGAAAREERTVVVDDVSADPRHLVCSIDTCSEIVVPIFKNGRVVGEIDIDSDTRAAFSQTDRELLETIAELLATVY
jgi:L-methionine (R)-S-oxide reductase